MPECYVKKRGYQLQCDKSLHKGLGGGGENGNFFCYVLFE